jgi:coenzyme PQQ precursor peptide PqqA
MKKRWTKPVISETPTGMEVTAYLSAGNGVQGTTHRSKR